LYFFKSFFDIHEELLNLCFEPGVNVIYSFSTTMSLAEKIEDAKEGESDNETDDAIEIAPIKSYQNLGDPIERSKIKQDNNKKAGVCLFTNKISGNIYVGSSVNLSKRYASYFSPSLSRTDLVIIRAIIRYGLENFTLDILEYVESSCENNNGEAQSGSFLLRREQYYLDSLKPSYNMLKVAGSPKGTK
jgi:hypothetical protein